MEHAILKLLIKQMLQSARYGEWSFHGLGFLRFYLSREVRVHIWDERYAKPASPIHTHPWDFRSTVIAGRLRQVRYNPITPAFGKDVYPLDCALIKCGEPEGHCGYDPQPRVHFLKGAEEVYDEGQSYSQRADEVHHSFPETGTVTLIERRFTQASPDHARVYWPAGEEFKPAAPWTLTDKQFYSIIDNSLKTWFK